VAVALALRQAHTNTV